MYVIVDILLTPLSPLLVKKLNWIYYTYFTFLYIAYFFNLSIPIYIITRQSLGDHIRFFTFRKLYLCVKGETTKVHSSSAVVFRFKRRDWKVSSQKYIFSKFWNSVWKIYGKMTDQKISEPLGYYIGRDRQPGFSKH